MILLSAGSEWRSYYTRPYYTVLYRIIRRGIREPRIMGIICRVATRENNNFTDYITWRRPRTSRDRSSSRSYQPEVGCAVPGRSSSIQFSYNHPYHHQRAAKHSNNVVRGGCSVGFERRSWLVNRWWIQRASISVLFYLLIIHNFTSTLHIVLSSLHIQSNT